MSPPIGYLSTSANGRICGEWNDIITGIDIENLRVTKGALGTISQLQSGRAIVAQSSGIEWRRTGVSVAGAALIARLYELQSPTLSSTEMFLVVQAPVCGVKLNEIPTGVAAADSARPPIPSEFTEIEGRDV